MPMGTVLTLVVTVEWKGSRVQIKFGNGALGCRALQSSEPPASLPSAPGPACSERREKDPAGVCCASFSQSLSQPRQRRTQLRIVAHKAPRRGVTVVVVAVASICCS